jgi:predicted permease
MPRLFRNHPGYVALATGVLAVSIGINLLVFTAVNALWIRPLPFPDADRVVTIPQVMFTAIDSPLLRIFEGGVAGQVVTTELHEALRPQVEIAGRDIETVGVTPGYFKVLHLPIRGRDFAAEDDRDGAEPVGIISDDLWARTFERRSEVIGAVLPAMPVPIRIIGVAPPSFHGARRGERADLWIATSLVRRLAPPEWSGSLPMMVFARLGPEQTVVMMQHRLESMTPNVIRAFQTAVTPVGTVFGAPDSPTSVIHEGESLAVVTGLALLVLLGGCATIAALVLMHYERRRGELALKMSLGAGRRRLVLELVRDLLWVGATGSVAGILVAALGVRLMPSLTLPGGVNLARLDLSIDWRIGAVAIAVTLLTLLVAGALPILRSTRLRLASELVTGPSATTFASQRVRQTLLALQVCTTIVVLLAAGLFVRAVLHGFGTAAGFDVDRTVFVTVQEGAAFRNEAVDRERLIAERSARLMSTLGALPGVIEVAEGISPIGAEALSTNAKPKTFEVRDQRYQLPAGVLRGSPNLLSALGVPMVAGRTLTAADATAAPHPAVISQSLAGRLWPDGGALGQTLRLPEMRGGPYLVVGVARDLAFGSLASHGSGVIVSAGPGSSSIVSSFVLRTDHPEMISGMVSRSIKAPVVRVATGREVIARDIGRQRLGAWLFSGFGVAALLLGVGGAFGLVAYLADSRRREFGVRLALGADWRDLVRHGLVAALAPVSLGVAAGLLLGALIAQLFEALLVGVSAFDVLTYLAVAVTMLGCATIAGLAAAWRLRRTAPSDALRAT